MLNAILPVCLLIFTGYALKSWAFLRQSFWEDAEKLAYYVLFPALLISKMSTADLSQVDIMPLASVLWLALGLSSLITLLLKSIVFNPILGMNNASFTSVYQGSVRFNTYIGLALISNLFDASSQALSIAVIVAAILIPVINILVVIILQCYGKQQNTPSPSFLNAMTQSEHIGYTLRQVLIQISKNPLIIGCMVGIALNTSGITLTVPLQDTLNIIGSTALPIGLMTVGAALLFDHFKTHLPAIAISSIIKLLLFPCIAYGLARLLGLDQQTQQIVVIFCALPPASAAYVLAKNMGGNHQLMATLITCQTLLSSITLLLVLTFLGLH